jgi:SAM-dependent methyltransferase
MTVLPEAPGAPAGPGRCPLCGRPEYRVLFASALMTVHECRACRFMYTPDRSGDFRGGEAGDEISGVYRWLERLRDERVAVMRQRIRELLARHPGLGVGADDRPVEVLEVGYGAGAFAQACVEAGWSYTGLEPQLDRTAPGGVDAAHPRLKILPLRLEEFHEEGAFDLVVLDNVLEHLADPVAAVRRAAGLVRPGGLLWVQVPNEAHLLLRHRAFSLIKTRSITFPGHVNLFTAATLRRCFAEAGAGEVELGGTSASHPVLTRVLLGREPGRLILAMSAVVRWTRADLLLGQPYWLDAYWLRPESRQTSRAPRPTAATAAHSRADGG